MLKDVSGYEWVCNGGSEDVEGSVVGYVGRVDIDTCSVHRRPHSRRNNRSMSGTVNDGVFFKEYRGSLDVVDVRAKGAGIDDDEEEPSLLS